MMKRGMAALLALCLLITVGWVETAAQEKLIEAEEGQKTALQISSLDGAKSVGILWVESEPQRRTWAEFSRVFTGFVKKTGMRILRFRTPSGRTAAGCASATPAPSSSGRI